MVKTAFLPKRGFCGGIVGRLEMRVPLIDMLLESGRQIVIRATDVVDIEDIVF